MYKSEINTYKGGTAKHATRDNLVQWSGVSKINNLNSLKKKLFGSDLFRKSHSWDRLA